MKNISPSKNSTTLPKPIVLIILDGWGHRESSTANAIAKAHTPVWDRLWEQYPHTTLSGSGLDVGLPDGQMGNSEVGHLTMGAGRVIDQDLTRITKAIQTGAFEQNPVFLEALQTKQTLHILGLLSPGGVHSHEDHIFALIRLAAKLKAEKKVSLKKIVVHPFLDGRDTPPKSAEASLKRLEELCRKSNDGIEVQVGSICGRYYAMDRDKRWERTQVVYELLTEGKSSFTATNTVDGLKAAYERGETDEFVKPTRLENFAPIADGDSVIVMNFRSDRMRQLCHAFTDQTFLEWDRHAWPKLFSFVTLTEYAKDISAKIAYPNAPILNILGEFLEKNGISQLRIAETEKYAHVTFFFNGGRETPFNEETRILIPSPKVATYDLMPEMSAPELSTQIAEAIISQKYGVIIANFANADMVGHTGLFEPTVKAIEALDQALGKIVDALEAVGGEALITADHGNAECMFDEGTQQPHTAHTSELVPFIYVGKRGEIVEVEGGNLSDIAPTIITLLGLVPPQEMTGQSLVKLK